MSDGSSEERCAALIAKGRALGPLGGVVFVDEGYSDDEIRVARETVQRLTGGKATVVRGKITMPSLGSLTVPRVGITVTEARFTRLAPPS